MKDFGNDSYSGDCFFLVGQLKGWTATGRLTSWRYWKSSTGIWAWGWLPALRFPFPGNRPPGRAGQTRRKARKARQALPVPGTEISACRTGVLATVRHHARTAGTLQGLLAPGIQQRNGRGQTVHLHFIGGRTHVRLQGQTVHQAVPPVLHARFLYGGSFGENYCFGLEQLPAKGDTLFITGGEKDVLSLAAHGFHAICFNSETVTIPPTLVYRLTFRFKHIVLLFDMDKTGRKAHASRKNYWKNLA